ncbi:Helix-turn-helix protein [Thiovulum sp. ES]|nr:Helix-turn-helix protein [Thiovulum sp. ES]
MEKKEAKSEENLVKKTCRELGITQKELAEQIGVAPVSISRWSRGENQIPKNIELLFKTLVENKNLKNINFEIIKFKKKLDTLTESIV